MRRLAALFLAAVVVAGGTGLAFAGAGMGEFSPGDAPPYAKPHNGTNKGIERAIETPAADHTGIDEPGKPGNSGSTPAPTAGPHK